jgi:hypothetical protein
MIFDRVIPLEVKKKKEENFSFHSLAFVGMCKAEIILPEDTSQIRLWS